MTTRPTANPDLRILVVDDEPFILSVTVHVLQQLGFQKIETACNGADALNIMHASTLLFELIICDLNMPVMDGLDFMKEAQAVNYAGALVVLSGEEPPALAAALDFGKECGLSVLAALPKPLEGEQLLDVLIEHGVIKRC
ncbi:MAG: response regulator [Pseudomonadota bacterium]